MLRYGKRSKAWDEFMLDGHLAICRHCNALIRHSGSTSNLLNHLKKHDIKPEKSEMELLNTEMLEDEPEEEMQAIQVYEEVLENNEIIEETTEPYEAQKTQYLLENQIKHNLVTENLEVKTPEKKIKNSNHEEKITVKPSESFNCKLCKRKFYTQTRLDTHSKSCNGIFNVCPICGEMRTRDHIRYHIKSSKKDKETSEKLFICDICGITRTSRSNIDIHMRVRHLKILSKCRICPATFKNPSALTRHMKISHSDKSKEYKCRKCNFKTMIEKDARNHLVGEFLDIHDKVETVNVDTACRICLSDIQKTIHVRFDDRIKSLGNLTYKDLFTEFIELELNALEPQHFCAVCAKKLVLMHEFKSKCYETQKILDEFIHNDQKHQIENMIVEETFEPIVPKTEDVDNENDNIEYLIEEVPANDIKYEELENVIENISQKYFAKDQTMADIVTRYECESCPSFYRSKNTLRIHYRRCHPLERTEDCQFCETKQFPIFLEDHMKNCRKNPNGKKNKTCPICGLLSNRNHIYRHVEANKLQNMGGNEKPYQCDICGVRTIAKAGMASHMQVQHLNYRLNCEVCGMDFKTPSVLSSHVRKYHPEKKSPLKCKICDYTTPDASSLRRHYLYHTGKKRHKTNYANVERVDEI
uniref:CSON001762 protein n=1 Tax=Culicoides sonorensis TaxID=179676 RepID=A0A336LRF9_CULSO